MGSTLIPQNQPPVVEAKDIEVQLETDNTVSIVPEQVLDTAYTVSCGPVDSLTLDISSFDCGDIGDNVVTLTAWAGGFSASSSATVTVLSDSIVPTAVSVDKPICGDTVTIVYDNQLKIFEKYSVMFDADAKIAGFVDVIDAPVLSSNELFVDVPTGMLPGNYNAVLSLWEPFCGEEAFDLVFSVQYSQDMLVQKWNNVIAVLNATNNGGYTFSDFQWLKNGEPIDNATSSYLHVLSGLDVNAEYSVLLTRADNGVQTESCPFVPQHRELEVDYPKVVSANESFVVKSEVDNTVIKMWNIYGVVQYVQESQSSHHQITAPRTKGIYLITIEGEEGQMATGRILVK